MVDLTSWITFGCVILGLIFFLFDFGKAGPNRNRGPKKKIDSVDYKKVDVKSKKPPKTGKNYLVVGTGSVGCSIIDALLERGETNIRAFDLVPTKFYSNNPNVQIIKGSVENSKDLENACNGIDVVFHTAAVITISNMSYEASIADRVNVVGIQNVINACKLCKVKAVVYTSTSNVVISAEMKNQFVEFTEEMPYSKTPINHYVRTKVQGEKIVLAAHSEQLKTIAIRPTSGIFGPRDNILVQKTLNEGGISIINDTYIDFVFVENVVHGHMLAEKALFNNSNAGGQAFFVSNNQPLYTSEFWETVQHFEPRVTIRYLPVAVSYLLAQFSTAVQTIFGKANWLGDLSLLTMGLYDLIHYSYSAKSDKAFKLLGYSPLYTVEEAIQKTIEEYKKNTKVSL